MKVKVEVKDTGSQSHLRHLDDQCIVQIGKKNLEWFNFLKVKTKILKVQGQFDDQGQGHQFSKIIQDVKMITRQFEGKIPNCEIKKNCISRPI